MPVPTPTAGETQSQFVSRCISLLHTEDPGRENDQIIAICYSQWRNREGVEALHPQFQKILSLFMGRYGDNMGIQKFWVFVHQNGLEVDESYVVQAQTRKEGFKEAFTWAKPKIEYLRQDKNAKYYAVRCIHAIVSMNDKSYENYPEMKSAGKSMNFRPVNINHDQSRWLPYPRTRLDYAKAEDFCVEGILRVDNQDVYFQKQLDHDPSVPEKEWIYHPSIEGRPDFDEDGYHFTAISMLEKGYALPGDPLSEVVPLFQESIQGEVCLFVDGMKVCLDCENDLSNGNKGVNVMEEQVTLEEGEGPINPEGAICPQCGHKITPDPTIEASAIKCPRCDTQMERLPLKTQEQARTEEERAMAHFNKTQEEWDALSPEEKKAFIDKLPPRGTGGENTETTEEPEKPEKITELFRPPFPTSANRKFKKTTGTALAGRTNVIGVGPVDGATIGIVEAVREIADLTEEVMSCYTFIEQLEGEQKIEREKIASLQEQIGSLEKLSAKSTALEAEVAERIGTTSTLKAQVATLESSVKEKENLVTSKEARIESLNKEIEKQNEDIGKLNARVETLATELSNTLGKARGQQEKAISETRERARFQEQNAALREDLARSTRKISDLTQQRSEDANKLMAQENHIAEIMESMRQEKENFNAKITLLEATLKDAKKFHSWAWDKLKEAGYAILEKNQPTE